VKDFYGPYKEYRQLQLDSERAQKELKQSQKKEQQLKATEKKALKTKLSYKEQKEYETLEKEIEELEQQKTALEEELNSGITDFEILQKLSEQIKGAINSIDEKTLRWMDLEELKEKLSS